MIEVEVEDLAWAAALPHVEAVVRRAAEVALASGAEARADVVILLADDAVLGDLNARFRGRDGPTNVLSFPAPESARPHLGDLALGYGVCAKEAAAQGKPLDQHLSHLVAHGVLHLLGYDHVHADEAEAMEACERTLMAALGWPDPYLLAEPVENDARP